jgi:hypothetical protein
VCWNFHGGEHLVYELLGRHLWGEWSWIPLWPFTNVQGRAYMHQGVSNKRWNQELVCPEALPVSATLMKDLAFVSVILYYTVQILCILYFVRKGISSLDWESNLMLNDNLNIFFI